LLNCSTSLESGWVMCQSKGSTEERQKKEREKRELEGGMIDGLTSSCPLLNCSTSLEYVCMMCKSK
jgi:hypothetical protein